MSIPNSTKAFILENTPVKNVTTNLSSPDSTFKLVDKPLGKLKDGELLVKVLYLSNDPTQRGWIQKDVDPERLYLPPTLKGDTMKSFALGQIVDSKSSKYSKGDFVTGLLTWEQYSIVNEARIFNKIENTSIPLTMYLDVIGLTGLTAYFGITEVGKLTKDQTIVISAASGATGSMCVQIAKHIIGAKKVIAITGSDSKCKYVESIGADVAVNYKDPKFEENLRKVIGKDYVDVYFDSVGGKILDIMLTLVKPSGRVVACGAISGYNDSEKLKIGNWSEIIKNKLTVQGFIVMQFADKYGDAIKVISDAVAKGKVKSDKDSIDLVDLTKDFSKIPQVWNKLFSDEKGPGKLLTQLSEYSV